MTLAVQPATDRDTAAVRALVAGRGLPLDGLDGVWRTWVVREDGRVVGTASLERHQDALLLRSVAVAPDRAARGVGSALVAAALAAADPIGPVALLTETAAGWFPRFGFAATTRQALPAALAASPELRDACPSAATAMLRAQPASGVTA
jgi:amino-acid N-acetyltransferase